MQKSEKKKKWLLNRRDKKGGFLRSSQALDDFGRAPDITTNSYIVFSLSEGNIDVKEEILALYEKSKKSERV